MSFCFFAAASSEVSVVSAAVMRGGRVKEAVIVIASRVEKRRYETRGSGRTGPIPNQRVSSYVFCWFFMSVFFCSFIILSFSKNLFPIENM